jgi:hypothetical protein
MSKRLILIFLLVFVASILVGGVIAYFYMSSNKKSSTLPSYIQDAAPDLSKTLSTTKPTADLTYKDESGFSFSYPKTAKVTDETPNDSVYYTKLNLTKDSTNLTISVFDTESKTIDDFIKTSSTYRNATLYGAVTLAGMSAKQYSLDGRLITLTLDQGVIYIIDGPKDSGYWEETQNIIITSFILTKSSSTVEEQEIVVQ